MNVYKDNPQLALTTLEKIAEEIPSGVSARDVGKIITSIGPNPDEVTEGLRETIASTLKGHICQFWASHSVCEKLEMANKLKRTQSARVCVPLSRQEIMNATKAKYLRLMKEELEARIEKVAQENCDSEKFLRAQSELIKQQIDDMKSCDFTL